MTRIFGGLALGQTLLILATATLGLSAAESTRLRSHVALAIFTSLAICAAHAAVFTYFTVTGKLIHQSIALGGFSKKPLRIVRRMKKGISSLVGLGVLTILCTVATGARALAWAGLGDLHLLVASGAAACNIWIYFLQFRLIRHNERLVNHCLRRYEKRRIQHLSQEGPAILANRLQRAENI